MEAIFKEIMREYEKDRNDAMRLLNKREAEIAAKIPRIAEIDKTLSLTGARITKAIISSSDDITEQLTEFERNNTALQKEKKRLLFDAGYAENYFESIYRCEICSDTGYTANMERCKCLTQRLITKHYAMSNVGKVLERENFDTFQIDFYSGEIDSHYGVSPKSNIEVILKTCLAFVSEFDNVFINLLLYGDSGLGKTFLCNCIAKELLDQGRSVLYMTAPQLFRKITDLRFNRKDDNEPEQYTDMILESDLLIIDDLGTEFITSIASTELFNFINTRLLNQKPTIISTNLSVLNLQEIYSNRITSRISGSYKMLRFFGDDIRIAKKYR